MEPSKKNVVPILTIKGLSDNHWPNYGGFLLNIREKEKSLKDGLYLDLIVSCLS